MIIQIKILCHTSSIYDFGFILQGYPLGRFTIFPRTEYYSLPDLTPYSLLLTSYLAFSRSALINSGSTSATSPTIL